jgi:ADP-L-glycero-D-manno-heptose 6-epimerase
MLLVTGGAGFIGSNVVAALCDRGASVVVCDRLRDGNKWRNVAKADFQELVEPERLDEWLSGRQHLEGVLHLGAISSTTERRADLIYDVNVRLSVGLWEWCAAHGTPLVYASSAATYGGGEHGFDDDTDPAALARLRPLNTYGWSKHFFDRRVMRDVRSGSPVPPQWVGLKFFNVYGPNEYHKGSMQSVVAQKYADVAAGRPVAMFASHDPAYENGGQLRDFIYVEDCVDVILWLLEHPRVNGIYNLGTGTARTFADLIRALGTATGAGATIDYVAMPESLRLQYQYYTRAEMQRLRAAGYERPFTTLEEGVRRYVEQFLARADRYR